MPQKRKSYVNALKGKSYQRDPMFFYKPTARPDSTGDKPGMALIEGDYKVMEWFESGDVELFNLKADKEEQHNIAAKKPEKVRSMLAKMRAMEEEVGNQREAGRLAIIKRLERKSKSKRKK